MYLTAPTAVFPTSPIKKMYKIRWDAASDDEEYAAALSSNDPGRITVYNPAWPPVIQDSDDDDLHLELSEIEDNEDAVVSPLCLAIAFISK